MIMGCTENSLKRFLKRKVKITLGMVVVFMITGTVSFADETVKIPTPNQIYGNLEDGIYDFDKTVFLGENEIYINSNLFSTWESARGYDKEIVFNGNIEFKNFSNINSTIFKIGINSNPSFVYDGILKGIDNSKVNVFFLGENATSYILKNNGLIHYTLEGSKASENAAFGLYTTTPKEALLNNGYIWGNGKFNAMVATGKIERGDGKFANNGMINLTATEESVGMLYGTGSANSNYSVYNFINNGILKGIALDSNIDPSVSTTTFQSLLSGMRIKKLGSPTRSVDNLKNDGIINLFSKDVSGYLRGIDINVAQYIEKLINNGKITIMQINSVESNKDIRTEGIYLKYNKTQTAKENNFYNNGITERKFFGKKEVYATEGRAAINFEQGTLTEFYNKGTISSVNSTDDTLNTTVEYDSYGLLIDGIVKNFKNNGIISGKTNKNNGFGVEFGTKLNENLNKFENKGIILGSTAVLNNSKPDKIREGTNSGLFITEGNTIFSGVGKDKINITNNGLYIKIETDGSHKVVDKDLNQVADTEEEVDNTNNVINGKIVNNQVQSIDLKNTNIDFNKGYVFNGFDKTLNIDNTNGEIKIKDSVVNAYKTAVNLNGGNAEFKNTIINGGLDTKYNETTGDVISETAAIKGEDGKDNKLTLINSTVNGKIEFGNGNDTLEIKRDETADGFNYLNKDVSLGAGNDTMSVSSNTYINGNFDSGKGTDILNLGDKPTEQADKNKYAMEIENNVIRIFGEVKNFEEINVTGQVHLYETGKITSENKDGKIYINKDSSLNVRIDPTKSDNGKLIGHGLYNSGYTISGAGTQTEGEHEGNTTAGTVNFVTNGIGHGGIIALGDTKLDDKVNIRTDSLIHSAVKKENDVKIEVVDDLEKIGYQDSVVTSAPDKPAKSERRYPQLNKIYRSLVSSGNFNINTINPTVTAKPDELDYDTDVSSDTRKYQLGNLLDLLNDIYANNPYAFSHDLSKESMTIFSDSVINLPFKPYEKQWMVYGGLTHNKGEITDTYYGKHLHEFDLESMSNDVEIESKLYGAYALAEYGKVQDLTAGIIIGGNKGESTFGNGAKLDGDLAYLGGYLKKYKGNWTFVGGLGVQYSELDSKRIASNAIQYFSYDEEYSDIGFNIYFGTKYSYKINDDYFLEPNLKLEYTQINQEAVSEKNKELAIDVDSKDFKSLDGKIGLDLKKVKIEEDKKSAFKIGVKYEYNFDGDEDQYLTGKMKGGYDFDILSPNKENNRVSFNLGYEVEKNNGWIYNINGSYGLTVKSHNSVKDDSDTRNESREWRIGFGFGYKFNDIQELFTLSVDNYFDFDKSVIKPEGQQKIKEASEKLNNRRKKGILIIEGHTDWTGDENYNQLLSEKRAKAVKQEFKANIKSEEIQYETKGYGETKPISDNKTKEGRAKNRRVNVNFKEINN